MRLSIFFRVFFWYSGVAIILLTVVLLFSMDTLGDHYIETLTANLSNLGNTIALKIVPLIEGGRLEDLDALAKSLGEEIGTRITVIDSVGVVIADSEKSPGDMENHRARPEVSRALRGGTGKSRRYSETVGEEMLYVAIPLRDNGRVMAVLRVSLFLKEIDSVLARLRDRIIAVAAIALAVSLLAAFLFSRALSLPVRNLINASRRFGEGDLDARVILKSGGELRELASSYNLMADRIKTLVKELSYRKEELSSIISAVRDGLLVLDSEGRILLSNEGFRSIVGENEVDGRFYWEVVRASPFGDLVRAARESRRHAFGEIHINQRAYSCGAAFVRAEGEIVVWLHDVTQIKNVERVKKDFIVNLSHELRTPLTAIKGFLEAAMDEASSSTQQYLDIVSKHTDRLTHIVGDLLSLSELEDKSTELDLEDVDLEEVAQETVKIFEQAAQEKSLTLEVRKVGDVPRVRADPYKLQQVLLNLIDNAVKYTESGSIGISIERVGPSVTVTVSDTGIGIPEEHVGRIFERFYVVDKSRSRTVGGTGLGLSIVKHIVLLHGWQISLTSQLGEGSEFKITIPTDVRGGRDS